MRTRQEVDDYWDERLLTSIRRLKVRFQLGTDQAGHDRREHLHRLAWHHDVAKAPPLTTLEQALAQLILGSDEKNWEIERILSGKAKHRRTTKRGSLASHHHDGEGRDLELERIKSVSCRLAHPI